MKKLTQTSILGIALMAMSFTLPKGKQIYTAVKGVSTAVIAYEMVSEMNAQNNFSTASLNPDFSYEIFKTNEPTNLFGNRKVAFRITNDFRYHFLRARDIYIDSISSWSNPFVTSNARISWINPTTKKLCFSSVDSLHFDYNTLKNKPASAQALTLTAIGASLTGISPSMTLNVPTYSNLNQFTNGPGYITSYSMTNISGAGSATVSGSFPNFTVNTTPADLSNYPTIGAVTSSVAALNGSINNRVPITRDITINGVTQNLAADRTWSIATPSTSYSGGTGISVSGTVITNTSPNQSVSIVGGNGIRITGNYPNYTATSTDYTATAATSGSVATFYLTSTGTSTGTALYTNISYVNPIINDVNGNYTFGWSYNAGTKALTVSARVATNTAVIALLGISLLGSTTPVPNATQISVLVKGN